jgi:hypothetical protein
MVPKEDMELANRLRALSSTGRSKFRWGNLNGRLMDDFDETKSVNSVWYGPYGWGVTGELVRFK